MIGLAMHRYCNGNWCHAVWVGSFGGLECDDGQVFRRRMTCPWEILWYSVAAGLGAAIALIRHEHEAFWIIQAARMKYMTGDAEFYDRALP